MYSCIPFYLITKISRLQVLNLTFLFVSLAFFSLALYNIFKIDVFFDSVKKGRIL